MNALRVILNTTLAVIGAALVGVIGRGHYRPTNKPRTAYGTIIVLGTAQYNGIPGRQFAARLRWAAELWHQHETQTIITVGGNLPGDVFTEAEVGRTTLLKAKVDPDCMIAVPEGNDTLGSYVALKPHLVGKALIVTDPHHALRAELLARLVGIDAQASPTPYCPTTFPTKSWFLSLSHELGGLIVVAIHALLGRRSAAVVEDWLRYAQGLLRPSRVARHEKLRAQ